MLKINFVTLFTCCNRNNFIGKLIVKQNRKINITLSTWTSQKFCNILVTWAAWDTFAEVVKVTNHTGL